MYNIENYFGLFIPSFLIISGLFLIFTSIQKKLPLSITWFAILILSSGNMLLVSYLQTSHPSTLLLFTLLALSLAIVISFYFSISKKFNIENNIIPSLLINLITIILLVYFSQIKKDLHSTLMALFLYYLMLTSIQIKKIITFKTKKLFDNLLKIYFLGTILILIVFLLNKSSLETIFNLNHHWFYLQFSFFILLLIYSSLLSMSYMEEIFHIQQSDLQKIRQQERLQLAHDLHDIVGGSLIRSISVVSQCQQNLSNQQFLSMLKLLRDDLREVIDSSSTVSKDIPKTPILWGAPIRHRFSQIFNELGIQSIWSFPEIWCSKPTALECLTLLRVTEEALTNVIKHSYAKKVLVRLYFSDIKQIILEIKDDGIGFNVDEISASNVNIGLKSMKIRLEKIQSTMNIHSRHGETIIKIIKN